MAQGHAVTAGAGAAVRLLLVNPRLPESFWSFRWALSRVLAGKRSVNPPLGLATVAALCPATWEVSIVDENVETLPIAPAVDLVGIGGMAVQHPRQRELIAHYRRRGLPVVAGGSYASLCPERFEGLADFLVSGEAEYLWPQFCRDFENATARPVYREHRVVDLADSPVPRFDLLPLERYNTVSLQFSRGCPYRCEFCDIIVMFGRRPRTKSPAQIGRELDRLRELGVRQAFFVDDNLIGHGPNARELLRFLADYQRDHRYRFQFGTEASLNMADDAALLELFRAANFAWVFLGIESPDSASLAEAGKSQNTRHDMLTRIRRLYQHGIDALGGFIIGFDADDLGSFARQERFITEAGIQIAMVGLLTALPRTPLWHRLEGEGRLDASAAHADNTCAGLNFQPLRMSREAAVAAHAALYRRLTSDRGIAARIRAKHRYLRRPQGQAAYGGVQAVCILARLLGRGILPGGPRRWARFVASVAPLRPGCWPSAVNDWIAGLSMRDFVERHLGLDARAGRPAARAVADFLHRRCRASLERGTLAIGHAGSELGDRLEIVLRGPVERAFFRLGARRLERALRYPTLTLRLRIESPAAGQGAALDALLARLARHGERIQVCLAEGVAPLRNLDSSVFHVVLEPGRLAGRESATTI